MIVSDGTLHRFAAFGGTLVSDLEFPELRRAPANATGPVWRFRTLDGAPEPTAESWTTVGEEEIGYGAQLRLLRNDAGAFRLHYTDSGVFDIAPTGSDIVWYRAPTAVPDLARMDVVGRVLATALHVSGALSLHASGVAVGGVGIGFMAPKFYGKSTLALALTYAGARLITDDTLAVLPQRPPVCVPGVHSVRLRSASAARFPRTRDAEPTAQGGRVVDALPDEQLMRDRVPLAALYLLTPVKAGARDELVSRTLIPDVSATMALLQHAKMGSLFHAGDATTNFERAAAIAGAVPVYALHIQRDLERIDEVARSIIDWHSETREPIGIGSGSAPSDT